MCDRPQLKLPEQVISNPINSRKTQLSFVVAALQRPQTIVGFFNRI